MITDLQTTFSGTVSSTGVRAGQSITASVISTNVLDRTGGIGGPAVSDESLGEKLSLVLDCNQAFNNLTSLTVELLSADDAALTTNATVHQSIVFSLARLTAATRLIGIALGAEAYRRYIGLRYTVTGTAPTGGSIFAFLTPTIQKNRSHAGNFEVDDRTSIGPTMSGSVGGTFPGQLALDGQRLSLDGLALSLF